MTAARRTVFITGAAGYIGSLLVHRLASEPDRFRVIASDVREIPPAERISGVEYITCDVRDARLRWLVAKHQVDALVHLASIVTPGGPSRRAFEHSVDVGGTENVLRACVETGVEQLIVTSSGAAYGYHADNPVPLRETDPLRGNPEFPYADHKRQVEERLADYRASHPSLGQLVLRPGTILGASTDNAITRLFSGRCVLGVAGYETPFVFIADDDVVGVIRQGIERRSQGIYNLAGDGTLSLREIARRIGKPYLPVPTFLFKTGLAIGQALGLTPHGPQQLLFLQYRPVLANDRLKEEFGYLPTMTSREAFDHYWSHVRSRRNAG